MTEITSEQLELVRMYIGELIGLKGIGKIIHSDPRTFKKEITELGIEVLPKGTYWFKSIRHFRGEFFHPISSELTGIITGSLLGDAQLRLQSKREAHENGPIKEEYWTVLKKVDRIREKAKQKRELSKIDIQNWNYAINMIKHVNTANFRIHKSIFELEWLKFFKEILNEEFPVKTYVKPLDCTTTKWTCGFDSVSSVQLFWLWEEWYKEKENKYTKVLPELHEITPNILLHWYLDDGYMSGYDISLCSFSFTIKENEKLILLLQDKGIKCKVRLHKSKPFINISSRKENKKTFLDFLEGAKYIKEAKEFFPYKFVNSISKKEWKKIQLEKYPEFQIEGVKIRKKLNDILK